MGGRSERAVQVSDAPDPRVGTQETRLGMILILVIYVAGVLLVLSMAVGVGVTAAVVVGWQSGRVATGSAETSTLETSMWESTGAAKASEDTALAPSDDTTESVSFVHRATDENSRGDYTYIGDPSINGNKNAIVLASPTPDQEDIGTDSYRHNIGVWY